MGLPGKERDEDEHPGRDSNWRRNWGCNRRHRGCSSWLIRSTYWWNCCSWGGRRWGWLGSHSNAWSVSLAMRSACAFIEVSQESLPNLTPTYSYTSFKRFMDRINQEWAKHFPPIPAGQASDIGHRTDGNPYKKIHSSSSSGSTSPASTGPDNTGDWDSRSSGSTSPSTTGPETNPYGNDPPAPKGDTSGGSWIEMEDMSGNNLRKPTRGDEGGLTWHERPGQTKSDRLTSEQDWSPHLRPPRG